MWGEWVEINKKIKQYFLKTLDKNQKTCYNIINEKQVITSIGFKQ